MWQNAADDVPLPRLMFVSYRLYNVTIALSLNVRPQMAIECLWWSNQQRVGGSLWVKILWCSPGVNPSCWGLQRQQIYARRTDRKLAV